MVLVANNKTYLVNYANCIIDIDDIEGNALLNISLISNNTEDLIELAQVFRTRLIVIPPDESESGFEETIVNPEAIEAVPVYLQREDGSTISFNDYIPETIQQNFSDIEEEIQIQFRRKFSAEEESL